MALVKKKLKELRNADVRYISLVDRAASRIPFRVLKRDKESDMIDLTRILKRDSKVEPSITSVVVFAQKDEKLTDKIRQSIADAGFKTDRVQKSDEETLVYSQGETKDPVALVRLSDQMLVTVKDFGEAPAGMFEEMVTKDGFYPGMSMAVGTLHERLMELVAKADANMAADVKQALEEFSAYAQLITTLPISVFKADTGVNKAVPAPPPEAEKQKTVQDDGKDVPKPREGGDVKTTEQPGFTDGGPGSSSSTVHKDEKVVEKKDCTDCGGTGKKDGKDCPTCGGSGKMSVAVKEEKKEEVKKDDSNMQAVLDAIKGVESSLTKKLGEVETKVEGVVTAQSDAKKVLDGVVTKADTLEKKLAGIVVAEPKPEDRVESKEVRKRDDDPRTGNFDTAFLRNRGRTVTSRR